MCALNLRDEEQRPFTQLEEQTEIQHKLINLVQHSFLRTQFSLISDSVTIFEFHVFVVIFEKFYQMSVNFF